LPGLFLCNVESVKSENGLATKLDLDAAVEFAPDWNWTLWPAALGRGRGAIARHWLRHGRPPPAAWKNHHVLDYGEMAARMNAKPEPGYLRFPGVTPMWDNAARRQSGAFILRDSTPEKYERWLATAAARVASRPADERIVFINAWNEWAEGNHLEPCQRWGRAYLEATRRALDVATHELQPSAEQAHAAPST
jgi:hypothetical protein